MANVQRFMITFAFIYRLTINDPQGSGRSEHALHHFHGLVLGAYERASRA